MKTDPKEPELTLESAPACMCATTSSFHTCVHLLPSKLPFCEFSHKKTQHMLGSCTSALRIANYWKSFSEHMLLQKLGRFTRTFLWAFLLAWKTFFIVMAFQNVLKQTSHSSPTTFGRQNFPACEKRQDFKSLQCVRNSEKVFTWGKSAVDFTVCPFCSGLKKSIFSWGPGWSELLLTLTSTRGRE